MRARKTEQVAAAAAAMRRGRGALESGILRACLTLFSRIRTYGTKFPAGEIRLFQFPLGLPYVSEGLWRGFVFSRLAASAAARVVNTALPNDRRG